jgi:hypothetical protein
MGKDEKSIYKKNAKTQGVTENVVGEQTIQTRETKILEGGNGEEILIGKDIEDVKKVEATHESLQRRILNKMMK